MPSNVSPVSGANKPIVLEERGIEPKAAPKGVSSDGSSIKSAFADTAAYGQPKTVMGKVKDCFLNIFKSIKNLFVSIFYRIFYCKAPPTDGEMEHSKFLARKERVDSLSDELASKEANEFPIVYTRLGKEVLKKSYNIFWKAWVSIPYLVSKTYYEIGRKEAEKNPKALISHLKAYYESQIVRLENQIRHGQI